MTRQEDTNKKNAVLLVGAHAPRVFPVLNPGPGFCLNFVTIARLFFHVKYLFLLVNSKKVSHLGKHKPKKEQLK